MRMVSQHFEITNPTMVKDYFYNETPNVPAVVLMTSFSPDDHSQMWNWRGTLRLRLASEHVDCPDSDIPLIRTFYVFGGATLHMKPNTWSKPAKEMDAASIIETLNRSESPPVAGRQACQCESGLAPESDTHTRTLQQDKVDCAWSQILAILALHWHLCIFCGWTALAWQRSWLCNLHHLIPSLPVTSWMSTLGIVVQTYNQCGNWLTSKYWPSTILKQELSSNHWLVAIHWPTKPPWLSCQAKDPTRFSHHTAVPKPVAWECIIHGLTTGHQSETGKAKGKKNKTVFIRQLLLLNESEGENL